MSHVTKIAAQVPYSPDEKTYMYVHIDRVPPCFTQSDMQKAVESFAPFMELLLEAIVETLQIHTTNIAPHCKQTVLLELFKTKIRIKKLNEQIEEEDDEEGWPPKGEEG